MRLNVFTVNHLTQICANGSPVLYLFYRDYRELGADELAATGSEDRNVLGREIGVTVWGNCFITPWRKLKMLHHSPTAVETAALSKWVISAKRGLRRTRTRDIWILTLAAVCLSHPGLAATVPRLDSSATQLKVRYASMFNSLDSAYDGTQIIDVKSDPQGRMYILGNTDSAHFPFPTPPSSRAWAGRNDVFIARLSSAGQTVEYLQLLGGSGDDRAGSLFVASDGSAYLTGYTRSSDFPTTSGAYEISLGARSIAAFAAKLDASGKWVYVTLLDGESGSAVAVDPPGNAYIAGDAGASIPTSPGALQTTFKGGADCFISKLNPAGSGLVYSTLVGGSDFDTPWAIAVDSAGNVYAAGETRSADFPVTAGAFRTQYGGGYDDAFVIKVNSTGTALIYSSYVASGAAAYGVGLALDSQGRVWLVGATNEPFPVTADAAQSTAISTAAYIARFSADGSHLEYASYFGASSVARNVMLDSGSSLWIAGWTYATDLPAPAVTFQSFEKAYVARFDTASGALQGFLYVGGRGDDAIVALAPTPSQGIYIGGTTRSPDFPTTPGALQPFFACGWGSMYGDGAQFVAQVESATPGSNLIVSVSAASYSPYGVAPASIAAGFGTGLATEIAAASSLPLPTSLGGVSMTITDSAGAAHEVPLLYVSPTQINYYVPEDVQPGAGTLSVSSGASGPVYVDSVVPGLFFSLGNNGAQILGAIALRVSADGTRTSQLTVDYSSASGPDYLPIDLGADTDQTYLELFGTGVRGGSGQSGVQALLLPPQPVVPTVVASLPVIGVAAQSQYVGLDQVNVQIPNSLRGAGVSTLMLCIDGKAANIVSLSIR